MLRVIHNQPTDGHPRRVFVPYAHQDGVWKHWVVNALQPLAQQQRINDDNQGRDYAAT